MTTKNSSPLYWTLLSYENWKVHIGATEAGLCFVGSQNQPYEELATWTNNRFPGHGLIQDDEKLQPYADELVRYFQGQLNQFTIPLFYRGTPFQEAVWKALCDIPYGQTRSYSEIAHQIQKPAAVRAVGTAIGSNPILITVPCHRVIGKNGSLTGYRGGMDMKTKLLELEQSTPILEKELHHV
ncbi:methylated-DNA--[protein]-cysteine S-methyltransferase [Paenibacillus sp. UMB4589-SE434]|uniref:methylated-DNA--[protein]-cysteine S-methyltransferase n=1 Tax=Paenibacillus sp. UMB4589-SE434 TaxID=3046314 RepID=UPI00254E8F29|nr:methylated-DNA--[protein]-cysteine S-methyltransferase [Paenibacillus sp. UMB4589-SE434]MDK8180083.1 methylated-DNA--[protein]-cysteine S-methyltransferase [Paenibacillus sp. UMB4589-SE434]